MLQKLNERFCTFAQAKELTQQGAIWAATTHRVKDQLNSQELQENMKSGATVVNVYAKHHRLLQSPGSSTRSKTKKTRQAETAAATAAEIVATTSTSEDFSFAAEDIFDSEYQKVLKEHKERADLLLYNPFYDDEGKRKSGLGYDKFVFLPLCILSINARVKLLTPVAKAAGLIRGARGRIIRFLYSNNANYGPAHPGASFEEAVTSTHQLQVPVVLVQFDAEKVQK
jgi:hypothetical protein